MRTLLFWQGTGVAWEAQGGVKGRGCNLHGAMQTFAIPCPFTRLPFVTGRVRTFFFLDILYLIYS